MPIASDVTRVSTPSAAQTARISHPAAIPRTSNQADVELKRRRFDRTCRDRLGHDPKVDSAAAVRLVCGNRAR
jgi:hypothetical protein